MPISTSLLDLPLQDGRRLHLKITEIVEVV